MNIFIAKLNPMTLSKDIQKAFENYGIVDAAEVIRDQYSSRSKCFGFVEMPDPDEATNAINALHDSSLDGYTIVVKKAELRDPRQGNEFYRGNNFFGNSL